MPLSSEQRRQYRAIAHSLKPVIIIGEKGWSEGLQLEIERALDDHELIKVKLASNDRETRAELLDILCTHTGAEKVQTIGKIAVVVRRARKPNPKLSNLMRGLAAP
ncbi:MAG: ribosome assembly RNA-binding protein YhbY [Gammaproteobacteria bacterium]|nr:ribosome assembly RNA-binding protein YhbY [Gammaproteobacteria bacterium]